MIDLQIRVGIDVGCKAHHVGKEDVCRGAIVMRSAQLVGTMAERMESEPSSEMRQRQ